MEEHLSIFKKATTTGVDRNIILNALQECRVQLEAFPLEKLEDDLMLDMMPCIRILLLEIYADNQKFDSAEQIEELLGNLTITISLTEFLDYLLDFVITKTEVADLKVFKSIFSEIPKCLLLTYKHCKESQKKYQNLMRDCKEILLLYKKNQDCHTKFFNVISTLSINIDDEICNKILVDTLQSVLSIIEVLLGLNIKTLADSWKSYCFIIEKHSEVLIAQKYYGIKEIELLELQIKSFMDSAVEVNDDKQLVQYSKLSGFLLKIALKIIVKFWDFLHIDHLGSIYNLVGSVYSYSPELLFKNKLESDGDKSIQQCLLDVITSFVEEKLLCEDMLEHLLSEISSTKRRHIGCLGLIIKILDFVTTQVPDTVDPTFFSAILNLIFSNFSTLFPDLNSEDAVELPSELIELISSKISESIQVHNCFYNDDFESAMISNILGNDIRCHVLASTIWIDILSRTSHIARKQIVSELFETIHQYRIHVTFSSSKVLLLKRFLHKLFNILEEEEKAYIFELYPYIEYIHVWRLTGLHGVFENDNDFGSVMQFLSSNLGDMKSLTSVEEVITSVEIMKLLADAVSSIKEVNRKTLTGFVQNLWGSNLESINCNNSFSKYFTSSLSEATIRLIQHFSNDQLVSILKRLEILATTEFMKVKLCFILSEITNRRTEHNMEQNKLNFVISDLLELLLKENNKTVHDFGLRIFQQYGSKNQHIIVNNVSRMLPHMNLEKHIQNNKNISLVDNLRGFNLTSVEHKCLESRKSFTSGNSFETKNRIILSRESSLDSYNGKILSRQDSLKARIDTPIFTNKPTTELKRSTNFNNGPSQCKRIKLVEDCQEEDDTVNEVLQRIKSEIKCLNEVLGKEKLTPKNAQHIKMLACQLQSVLEN